MSHLLRDLRYAVRMLRAAPALTAAALLALGLGIGANTAIFSLIKGVILDPLQLLALRFKQRCDFAIVRRQFLTLLVGQVCFLDTN